MSEFRDVQRPVTSVYCSSITDLLATRFQVTMPWSRSEQCTPLQRDSPPVSQLASCPNEDTSFALFRNDSA